MSKMLPGLAVIALALAVAARAEDDVKASAVTDAATASEASAAAPPAKAAAEAFTPPPGWHEKKRGKFTLYCRKQAQMGSRVPTEVCYDETGIRAMLASQAEDREKADQMRRICGSQAACGSN